MPEREAQITTEGKAKVQRVFNNLEITGFSNHSQFRLDVASPVQFAQNYLRVGLLKERLLDKVLKAPLLTQPAVQPITFTPEGEVGADEEKLPQMWLDLGTRQLRIDNETYQVNSELQLTMLKFFAENSNRLIPKEEVNQAAREAGYQGDYPGSGAVDSLRATVLRNYPRLIGATTRSRNASYKVSAQVSIAGTEIASFDEAVFRVLAPEQAEPQTEINISSPEPMMIGETYIFDRKTKTLTVGEKVATLTDREFMLVSLLDERKNQTISISDLQEELAGAGFSSRAARLIFSIEEKLGEKIFLREGNQGDFKYGLGGLPKEPEKQPTLGSVTESELKAALDYLEDLGAKRNQMAELERLIENGSLTEAEVKVWRDQYDEFASLPERDPILQRGIEEIQKKKEESIEVERVVEEAIEIQKPKLVLPVGKDGLTQLDNLPMQLSEDELKVLRVLAQNMDQEIITRDLSTQALGNPNPVETKLREIMASLKKKLGEQIIVSKMAAAKSSYKLQNVDIIWSYEQEQAEPEKEEEVLPVVTVDLGRREIMIAGRDEPIILADDTEWETFMHLVNSRTRVIFPTESSLRAIAKKAGTDDDRAQVMWTVISIRQLMNLFNSADRQIITEVAKGRNQFEYQVNLGTAKIIGPVEEEIMEEPAPQEEIITPIFAEEAGVQEYYYVPTEEEKRSEVETKLLQFLVDASFRNKPLSFEDLQKSIGIGSRVSPISEGIKVTIYQYDELIRLFNEGLRKLREEAEISHLRGSWSDDERQLWDNLHEAVRIFTGGNMEDFRKRIVARIQGAQRKFRNSLSEEDRYRRIDSIIIKQNQG